MEDIAIIGKVKKIKFFNNENYYTIFDVETDNKKITVLGYTADVLLNDYVEIKGQYHTKKYKNKITEQFQASAIKKILPTTKETVLEYLSSGIIKGIGKSTAKQIFSIWGEKSLEIIEQKPQLLSRVSGIGSKKIANIMNSWDEVKPKDNIIDEMIKMGFNSFESILIFKKYKDESVLKIKENPYKIYHLIKHLNFDKVDRIAMNLNFSKNDPIRIKTYIEYAILENHNDSGDTIINEKIIKQKTKNKLRIDDNDYTSSLNDIIDDKIIYRIDNTFLQHGSVYEAELEIAQKLYSLSMNTFYYRKYPKIDQLANLFRKGEKQIPFTDEQKSAILTCINNKISVLTGKPGTGKTTVTNEIVKQLRHLGKSKIKLCAPTGKAAQKMKESTGEETHTIHRLLEYNPIKDRFERNIKNPLDCDVLIIDEASMIDIFLMANLLRAIGNETQVILIGDVNQLPSINCGAVLRDIINSNTIEYAVLAKIHRTGEQSEIITTSHHISNTGEFNVISNKNKKSDLYFINSTSDENTLEKLHDIIQNKMESTFKCDLFNDVQILTSVHKGMIGTININKEFQKILNKKFNPNYQIQHKNFTYSINDKVIQLKNNYDKEVYNGDSGVISAIENNLVIIQFENKEVIYKKNELNEICLSYCLSIHKTQGSEYSTIIIPLPQNCDNFADRSLIYTGITRGKSNVIIIGNRIDIENACRNNKNQLRKTYLMEHLKHYFINK